jgi:hypothetical protein
VEVEKGCRKLRQVKVLLRRAVDAPVSLVCSAYDLAAKVRKLDDGSREAQGAYRVHRGGR